MKKEKYNCVENKGLFAHDLKKEIEGFTPLVVRCEVSVGNIMIINFNDDQVTDLMKHMCSLGYDYSGESRTQLILMN